MRLMEIFLVLMFTTTSAIKSGAGGASTGISPGEEALGGFLLAVADYYRIPQVKVKVIRERGIPPYEIPVALFIAKKAHVAPEIVIDFRLRDNTWLYTTLRCGLGPEIFYVPVSVKVKDQLYGKIYGYYQHTPKEEWRTIVLSDSDIIDLVNLKLMSEHYGYPPEEIMKMRSEGVEFGAINDEIFKKKGKNQMWGKEGLKD